MSKQSGGHTAPQQISPTHDPLDVLRERGISDEVIERRGYIPFYGIRHPRLVRGDGGKAAKAERDALLAKHWPRMTKQQTADMKSKMSKAPQVVKNADGTKERHTGYGQGLIIPKFAFPQAGRLPAILPQLRPEHGFPRPPKWHWHDGSVSRWRRVTVKTGPKKGRTPWARAFGAFDLTTVQGQRNYRNHIRDEHGADLDFPLDARHEHDDSAKYTLPLGKGESKRLDVHPSALDRIPDADVVFYSIEGTLKGDAILSHIIANELSSSVFSTPSVTTAMAKELRRVARGVLSQINRHGRKPLVVIVPDADWVRNELVMRSALFVRDVLGEEDVRVCIAAPPILDLDEQHPCKCDGNPQLDGDVCSSCGGFKKGVDDYLAAGGVLAGLMVLDRQQVGDFKLAIHADTEGYVYGSWATLARRLGKCRKDMDTVVTRLTELRDQGKIEIVGGTLAKVWRTDSSRKPDGPGRWYLPSFKIRIPDEHRVADSFPRLVEYQHRYKPTVEEQVVIRSIQHWQREQPRSPWVTERHVDSAIDELHPAVGQRATLNRREEVVEWRRLVRETRDAIIRMDDGSTGEIAAKWNGDISLRQVQRIKRNGNGKTEE